MYVIECKSFIYNYRPTWNDAVMLSRLQTLLLKQFFLGLDSWLIYLLIFNLQDGGGKSKGQSKFSGGAFYTTVS